MTERAVTRGVRAGSARRRIIGVIALGALAVGALSACRTEAGAASFVGNTKISESFVDNVAASVPAAAQIPKDQVRALAVDYQTFNVLAAKLAKDKGWGTATASADEVQQFGQQLGLSAGAAQDNAFIQVLTQADAWKSLLASKVTPAKPTPDAERQVYDNLVASQAVDPSTPFASVQGQIAQIQVFPQAMGLQNELEKAAKTYDVSINPRYAQPCTDASKVTSATCSAFEIPLLQIQGQSGQAIPALYLRIGENGPGVIDQVQASPAASS